MFNLIDQRQIVFDKPTVQILWTKLNLTTYET